MSPTGKDDPKYTPIIDAAYKAIKPRQKQEDNSLDAVAKRSSVEFKIPSPPAETHPEGISNGRVILLSQKSGTPGLIFGLMQSQMPSVDKTKVRARGYKVTKEKLEEERSKASQELLTYVTSGDKDLKVEYVDSIPEGFVGIAIHEMNGKTNATYYDGEHPHGVTSALLSDENSKNPIRVKDIKLQMDLEAARNNALSKTQDENARKDINTSFDILQDFRSGNYHTIMNHPKAPNGAIAALDSTAKSIAKDNPELAEDMRALKSTLKNIQTSKEDIKVATTKDSKDVPVLKPFEEEPQIIRVKEYKRTTPLEEDKKLTLFEKLKNHARKLAEAVSPKGKMARINPDLRASGADGQAMKVLSEALKGLEQPKPLQTLGSKLKRQNAIKRPKQNQGQSL